MTSVRSIASPIARSIASPLDGAGGEGTSSLSVNCVCISASNTAADKHTLHKQAGHLLLFQHFGKL